MDFHTKALLLALIILRGIDSQFATVGIKPKEYSQLTLPYLEWNNPSG